MNQKKIIFSLLIFTLSPTLFFAEEEKDATNNMEDKKYSWIKTTADIISTIEERAFRQTADFGECIQKALKSYLAHIDAHTSFFTSEGHKSIKEIATGKFSGIGVSITGKALEDDSLVLIDVIESGPAHRAGLMKGDKIFEVDGTKLQGLSSDEAINLIKGKQGTTVKIKIIRGKKPLEFKVKRDTIKDEAGSWYHFKDYDIYYCALKIFNESAAEQMKKMLIKIKKQKCRGLIIDVRNNPGGLLDSAIDMASLFIPQGSIVTTTKNNKNIIMNTYKTTSDPIISKNIPIFIITNNFSASASEILAGCLKHYANNDENGHLQVFLVGNTTYGKGSVQEVIPVGQGCAMKLTTMLYYLPDNTSIQATGIEPDFLIQPKTTPEKELKWIEEVYGRETSLKNHITALDIKKMEGEDVSQEEEKKYQEKLKKKKQQSLENNDENDITHLTSEQIEERHKQELQKSVQIQACINMINIVSLAKKALPKAVENRKKTLTFLKKHFITDDPVSIESIK
ncbi:S41 family peptidase [Candidatus Babeliales bacterium]|nr:S41 family peptidase [Candidatus Babeliales bacterium]